MGVLQIRFINMMDNPIYPGLLDGDDTHAAKNIKQRPSNCVMSLAAENNSIYQQHGNNIMNGSRSNHVQDITGSFVSLQCKPIIFNSLFLY
ncbi:hypothetical protein DPMN_174339 [Dreissena polymorpha]|uniref:Uncharacterized protein n=1 Tax=Dreissena polymorpha TaxID=45954 RepID=A0A9D4E645_DREPO|nr:hypothetical protein DPMN_174339 [Dreissena polymorpha]